MHHEESFVAFLRRTIITFWAFVTLGIMLLITAAVLGYIGNILYKHITRDKTIIITRSI
jgi:hypothetical protein